MDKWRLTHSINDSEQSVVLGIHLSVFLSNNITCSPREWLIGGITLGRVLDCSYNVYTLHTHTEGWGTHISQLPTWWGQRVGSTQRSTVGCVA